jgi:hypothetical protein
MRLGRVLITTVPSVLFSCTDVPDGESAVPRDLSLRGRCTMKNVAGLTIMLLFLSSCGCASRNVYDGLRFHQEMDCQKLQGIDLDECVKRSGMSYDEYQRQLKERDQTK